MFDFDSQHYYNRARWYNPYNGRFNRMDPFAGSPQDPLSLHKYLYCYANPINAIDPSGNFSITSTLVNMAISSILQRYIVPVVAPYVQKAAALILPNRLVQKLMSGILPTVGVAGIGGSVTFGLGKLTGFLGGGVVAARELMWSLSSYEKSAIFDISGWTGGWMGGAGVALSAAIFGGLLWGVKDSRQYSMGQCNTITIPGNKLFNRLKKKMDSYVAQFYTGIFAWPSGIPSSEIMAFQNAANQAISGHSVGVRIIYNFHFSDDFSVYGFTWGVATSLGRGLLVSYSRTTAKQRSPSDVVYF